MATEIKRQKQLEPAVRNAKVVLAWADGDREQLIRLSVLNSITIEGKPSSITLCQNPNDHMPFSGGENDGTGSENPSNPIVTKGQIIEVSATPIQGVQDPSPGLADPSVSPEGEIRQNPNEYQDLGACTGTPKPKRRQMARNPRGRELTESQRAQRKATGQRLLAARLAARAKREEIGQKAFYSGPEAGQDAGGGAS
jgi:hypothetical protein